MIPYIEIPPLFHIIHSFGVLVAIGILVGARLVRVRAKEIGLDDAHAQQVSTWVVVGAFIVGHVFDVVAYRPQELLSDRWYVLFEPWAGLSSFGGFIGALAGFLAYARRLSIDRAKAADAICYGLPVGWFFGRLGCTVVHDHPGLRSTAWLALDFPGGPRFDLGLLELLCTPLLVAVVVLVAARTRRPGAVSGALALTYPLVRFPLDFLRATDLDGGDARYLGLTPAQYACVALVGLGAWLLARAARTPAPTVGNARSITR